MKCFVLFTHEDQVNFETIKIWLVKCSPYMDHPCKNWCEVRHVNWYGYPTEVWASTLENLFHFYLLEEITELVVFVKTKINFGHTLERTIFSLLHH